MLTVRQCDVQADLVTWVSGWPDRTNNAPFSERLPSSDIDAAEIEVAGYKPAPDGYIHHKESAALTVCVENSAGHCFKSAYPSSLRWGKCMSTMMRNHARIPRIGHEWTS